MSNEAKAIKALEEIKDLAFKRSVSSNPMHYVSAVGELYAKAVNALAELDATPLPNDLEQAAEYQEHPIEILDQLNAFRIEAINLIKSGEKESVAHLSALIAACRLGRSFERSKFDDLIK